MSLANSPAIVAVQDDFVDKLLAGDRTTNIAAASAVAGVYFIFLLLELFNFVRERIAAHALLMLFCSFRVVCFSVRAYMQHNITQNLAIVYEVFFAIGFVALVKLLVSLLVAWTLPVGVPLKRGAFSFGLLRNHGTFQERVITILLFVGAVTSIIGATDAYSSDATIKEYNKGLHLLQAGYTIYLAAIVLYDFAVITGPLLSRLNFGRPRSLKSATMVVLALEVCGLLITTKAVFQVIAIYANPSLTFNNKLFYPLEVCPELLTLCIVCIPGFISHVYKGSHSHAETDGATLKAAEAGVAGKSPAAAENGISPTSAVTTPSATPVHTPAATPAAEAV